MEARIPVREVNQNFSKYLKSVENGTKIIVTKYGHAVAQIIPIKARWRLSREQRASKQRILQRMKKGFHLGGNRFNREELYDR